MSLEVLALENTVISVTVLILILQNCELDLTAVYSAALMDVAVSGSWHRWSGEEKQEEKALCLLYKVHNAPLQHKEEL